MEFDGDRGRCRRPSLDRLATSFLIEPSRLTSAARGQKTDG
jgi:hypothetical protein